MPNKDQVAEASESDEGAEALSNEATGRHDQPLPGTDMETMRLALLGEAAETAEPPAPSTDAWEVVTKRRETASGTVLVLRELWKDGKLVAAQG
jgi:hypothetical protein